MIAITTIILLFGIIGAMLNLARTPELKQAGLSLFMLAVVAVLFQLSVWMK